MIWSKLTTHHNSISQLRCKGGFLRLGVIQRMQFFIPVLLWNQHESGMVGSNNGWGLQTKNYLTQRQLLSGVVQNTLRNKKGRHTVGRFGRRLVLANQVGTCRVMRPTRVFSCPLRRARVKQQIRRTQIFGSLQKWVASQRLCFCSCWLFMSILFQHILKSFLIMTVQPCMLNLSQVGCTRIFYSPGCESCFCFLSLLVYLTQTQRSLHFEVLKRRWDTWDTLTDFKQLKWSMWSMSSKDFLPHQHACLNKNQLWMLSSNTARLQCSLHITGVIPWCLASLLDWSPCFLVVYPSYQHCTVDWIWNPNITSKLNPIIVMYNTSIYIYVQEEIGHILPSYYLLQDAFTLT